MSQGKMSKVVSKRQNIPKLRQVAQPFRKVAQSCTKVWELHFMLTKIVQSFSKFTLFFRKIFQSCKILHKASEGFPKFHKVKQTYLKDAVRCAQCFAQLSFVAVDFRQLSHFWGNLGIFCLFGPTFDIFPCDMGPIISSFFSSFF